jgi:hypothetical protein
MKGQASEKKIWKYGERERDGEIKDFHDQLVRVIK